MCGIVGERFLKDTFRTAIRVDKQGEIRYPDQKEFDHLERLSVSDITAFLQREGLLPAERAKAGRKLAELRNSYAHASVKVSDDMADARKAIQHLHVLVEPVPFGFPEENDAAMTKRATIRECMRETASFPFC